MERGFVVSNQTPAVNLQRRAQPLLGTLVDISVSDAGISAGVLTQAFRAAFSAVQNVHTLMSFHCAQSDVGRFNRARVGDVLEIDLHTVRVLAAAEQLRQHSGGLFDVRVASRLAAWGILPTDQLIETAQTTHVRQAIPAWHAGAQAFRLDAQGRLEKCTDDWIDVGGIAKGYAVDGAIEALQQFEITHAMVNAGGDLRVIGAPQQVGIRDPLRPQRIAKKIWVDNQALATSASYFSVRQGADLASVSALVNGVSGEAIVNPASVSVLATQCVWADALTKVVAANGDAQHPCLRVWQANAFII